MRVVFRDTISVLINLIGEWILLGQTLSWIKSKAMKRTQDNIYTHANGLYDYANLIPFIAF